MMTSFQGATDLSTVDYESKMMSKYWRLNVFFVPAYFINSVEFTRLKRVFLCLGCVCVCVCVGVWV